MTRTELRVVGAGPYGLSTAALARERGIDVVVLGRSMDFWHENMPPGFYITGFSATRDFGPFFGFVKGSPAAATIIVRDLVSRGEARQPHA